MKGGYATSPLSLNEEVRTAEDWNEAAIKHRAKHLAEKALKVWKYPSLPLEQAKVYFSEKLSSEFDYTIKDHPHLDKGGACHDIFMTIRAEIVDIDPCVTEEFRKHYAVYIAEQIFISIGAISSGLTILLYLPFAELQDSRGITKQIPATHNWGRAEAELLLNDPSEIPYVMSLIRQAFRHQMEDEE